MRMKGAITAGTLGLVIAIFIALVVLYFLLRTVEVV